VVTAPVTPNCDIPATTAACIPWFCIAFVSCPGVNVCELVCTDVVTVVASSIFRRLRRTALMIVTMAFCGKLAPFTNDAM